MPSYIVYYYHYYYIMNYISPRHAVRYAWSGPAASQLLRAHPIPLSAILSYLVSFILLFDSVFIIIYVVDVTTRDLLSSRETESAVISVERIYYRRRSQWTQRQPFLSYIIVLSFYSST